MNEDGEKRIRVHTVKTPLGHNVRICLEHANSHALLNLIAKEALSKILEEGRLTRARAVVDKITRVIARYDVIPPALDSFMLRSLGLLKHAVLSSDRFTKNIWVDTVAYFRSRLMNSGK